MADNSNNLYATQCKGDVGQRIFNAAEAMLRPRAIEDIVIGFGTPDDNQKACEGVFSFEGRQYLVRFEEID